MLYKTIIQPHFDYCAPVWSNASRTLLNPLFILQKRALKIVMGVDSMYSTQALFADTQVDTLFSHWKKQSLILIYKMLTPRYLSARIHTRGSQYTLRNISGKIQLPKPNVNILKRGFLYSSSKFFNDLPEKIRNTNHLSSFVNFIIQYPC